MSIIYYFFMSQTVLTFGKYKGRKICDLDKDCDFTYLSILGDILFKYIPNPQDPSRNSCNVYSLSDFIIGAVIVRNENEDDTKKIIEKLETLENRQEAFRLICDNNLHKHPELSNDLANFTETTEILNEVYSAETDVITEIKSRMAEIYPVLARVLI